MKRSFCSGVTEKKGGLGKFSIGQYWVDFVFSINTHIKKTGTFVYFILLLVHLCYFHVFVYSFQKHPFVFFHFSNAFLRLMNK